MQSIFGKNEKRLSLVTLLVNVHFFTDTTTVKYLVNART